MPKNFQLVTPENTSKVQKAISKRLGRIVVVEPGHWSHYRHEDGDYQKQIIGIDMRDINISLYDKPSITKDWLSTSRGGSSNWQTGWENDRAYWLRETPKPSGDLMWDMARSLFDKLAFKGYEFKISPGVQLSVGRTLPNEPGYMLFVPRKKCISHAFRDGLTKMIEIMNSNQWRTPEDPLNKKDIENIVEYMMQDLDDGKVSDRNLQAGMQADAMVF